MRRERTPFLCVGGCNTELHVFPGKPVFETPSYHSTWPLKVEREQDRAVLGELIHGNMNMATISPKFFQKWHQNINYTLSRKNVYN